MDVNANCIPWQFEFAGLARTFKFVTIHTQRPAHGMHRHSPIRLETNIGSLTMIKSNKIIFLIWCLYICILPTTLGQFPLVVSLICQNSIYGQPPVHVSNLAIILLIVTVVNHTTCVQATFWPPLECNVLSLLTKLRCVKCHIFSFIFKYCYEFWIWTSVQLQIFRRVREIAESNC